MKKVLKVKCSCVISGEQICAMTKTQCLGLLHWQYTHACAIGRSSEMGWAVVPPVGPHGRSRVPNFEN